MLLTYPRAVPIYFACRWHHDSPDEPVLLFEELNDERLEIRKVEQFADGRLIRSDRIDPERTTTLSWVEVPPLDQIAADPEFTVQPLTAADFESVWRQARDA